ncbi:LCP family protein [uncultured Acetatifactor sp.]|uniref:LCP family protein n=1 Tax=uncultured Acetatifactor sp. TaxID=1671927 RepID=UPI0026124D6D|nr:LCP family protein [uncultured Acetatifactor sp.]
MDDNNKNEMEQIQRGLEAFLEKEIDGAGDPGSGRREPWPPESPEVLEFPDARREPQDVQVIGGPWSRGRARREWESREDEGAYAEDGEDWDDWEDESRWSPEDGGYEEEEPYPEDWREEEGPRGRRSGYREEPYRRRRPGYEAGAAGGRRPEYGEEPPRRRHPEYGSEPADSRRPEYGEEPPRRRGAGYKEEPPGSRRREYEAEPPRRRKEYEEDARPQRRKKSQKKGNSKETEPEQREGDSRMTKKPKAPPRAQKKRRRKKHRLRKFLIAVVLIIALLGVGLYQLVGAVYGKMNYKELPAVAAEPMKEDGVVNILLIGNDSRENGEDGRSDAMILLSISSRTKTIYMTSLLRDIYVDIPGHDGNRLNAAYAFGGAELLMKTIEHNFGIPVNRYMLVNFEAFANLVDAVDGIELELTRDEIEYVNGYLVEYNMLTGREQGTDNMDLSVADNGPAVVHLNGPQALAYSRNRYLGTDFGRTERQRKVLTAVIGKLPGAVLTNAGGLIDSLMPNLTTNLTKNECFSLSLMAGKLLTYDIVSDNIPQPDTYRDVTIREMQVLEVDFETNTRYLREKIYGE